jgi:hypothetical protein
VLIGLCTISVLCVGFSVRWPTPLLPQLKLNKNRRLDPHQNEKRGFSQKQGCLLL